MQSKADEISILKQSAACCAPGSYLAMLFTKEMVEWCAAQIQMDYAPDLYAALLTQNDASGKMHAQLNEKQRQIERHENTLVANDKLIAELRQELKEARETTAALIARGNEYLNRSLDLEEQLGLAQHTLQSEIDRLKIKLFDLMDSAKNEVLLAK